MSYSPEESISYIIGSSSGMGLAMARLPAAGGATVVVIGRDAKRLERRKNELHDAVAIASSSLDLERLVSHSRDIAR